MTSIERIRKILTGLEEGHEDLLALSDEIWDSIDHNNSETLEEGVELKKNFNEQLGKFQSASDKLTSMLERWARSTGKIANNEPDQAEENARTIQALPPGEIHTLDENFTFKRPCAVVIEDSAYADTITWRKVLSAVCGHLAKLDAERFKALPETPDCHGLISANPETLRSPQKCEHGLHVETNLSANNICRNIAKLLSAFGLPPEAVKIHLREDRNAGPIQDSDARPDLERFIEQFENLRVNPTGGHPSPHKPAMILSVIDLIEGGHIQGQHVHYDDKLRECFGSWFDKFKREGDACNPHLPFFHLKSEPFWHLEVVSGREKQFAEMSSVGGQGELFENVTHAVID